MHGKEANIEKVNLQKTEIFYGKILEIKPAMGYKYLKIDENGKTLWVAIANAPVKIGEKIGYDKKTLMKDFKSQSLNQKFEEIYFASEVYLAEEKKNFKSLKSMLDLSPSKKDPHAGMGRGMTAEPEEIPSKPFIKKDAYSIEEIHMWRKDLKDQNIRIEATVFKVSHGIMKRDWVHLGDGSGNEKKLTDDLVFTTASTGLKKGDKVIARGKVVVDKDFGYGYFYKVIIEEATFKIK
ncbi:NrfJ [hydrothermal vent metagenome]|uniref:NrfJ n=1 Tax=hydrothermal vent metagenome TaxID=652676 RepID=A0A1W1D066_9ZZZZ